MIDRLERSRTLLSKHTCDAALISALPVIRWATGFTGSNALLIVTRRAAHLVTDGRYAEQAEREVQGITIHVAEAKLLECARQNRILQRVRRAVFQADHLTVSVAHELPELFPVVQWVPGSQLLVREVASKETHEVECIKRAQAITDEVFGEILGLLKPGVSERDIAAEIAYRHLLKGADDLAFQPIVSSGADGSLPHARASGRKLKKGDLVLMDFGCIVEGYASDMTRTVAIGAPSATARKVYETVLRAQEQAILAARAGMSSKALDSVARNVIDDAGYGEFFVHSLGHGIGLQVHEWPRISQHVDVELPENVVITIEPGIYLPGRLGVRIEDMVVVGKDGCEILTHASKDLLVV